MLTKLPEDATVLFHPIVFFDQGTYFFETRRRINGDALFHRGSVMPSEARAKRIETSEHLVVDPIEPLRRLDATCTPAMLPADARRGEPNASWECQVRCPGITQGSWSLLAIIGPDDIERIRAAVGELPGKQPGFSEEEWLLRHAFSDERVRENSFLAATLARLPILFARGYTGGVTFRSRLGSSECERLGSGCRFVAVVDTSLT